MDLTILLLVGIASMAFVAYELAGLTLPGWHTLSYWAHHYLLLRLAILASFPIAAAWWWIHSGNNIPK